MDYFAATRAFVRAAELQSFSKAAQDLAVKVSTVSRQIGELERDLGIALFNRSTRGLALTEGGKTFLARARRALDAMDEAREATSALNQSPKGVLRLTLPPAFGRRHVLPHLPAFIERYPEIDVDAIVTDDLLNLIESGIDLALRVGELKDSSLMARRLAPHRLIACAQPGYLDGHGTPAHPHELRRHACLPGHGPRHERWHFEQAGRRLSVVPDGRFRSNDLQALLEMALAGAGIAMLPDWLAAEALAGGGLRRVLDGWTALAPGVDAAIWAVYPPKKTVSSKVRSFVDFFAERIGQALR